MTKHFRRPSITIAFFLTFSSGEAGLSRGQPLLRRLVRATLSDVAGVIVLATPQQDRQLGASDFPRRPSLASFPTCSYGNLLQQRVCNSDITTNANHNHLRFELAPF